MRALAGLLGLALIAAACGGNNSPVGSGGSRASELLAFSLCMRSHGVANYPDPNGSGKLVNVTLQQLGVGQLRFQSANRACMPLLPNGGNGPTPAEVQQYRSTMLTYARCIRAHGVANMPDPDSRGHLDIGPGTDVDVNSPQFQAAYVDCKKDLSP